VNLWGYGGQKPTGNSDRHGLTATITTWDRYQNFGGGGGGWRGGGGGSGWGNIIGGTIITGTIIGANNDHLFNFDDTTIWDDIGSVDYSEEPTCEDDGDDDDGCYQNQLIDENTCRALGQRGEKQRAALCWAAAKVRFGECRQAGGVHGIRTPLHGWTTW